MRKIASADESLLGELQEPLEGEAGKRRNIGAYFLQAVARRLMGQPAGSHPGTEYSFGMSNRSLLKIAPDSTALARFIHEDAESGSWCCESSARMPVAA